MYCRRLFKTTGTPYRTVLTPSRYDCMAFVDLVTKLIQDRRQRRPIPLQINAINDRKTLMAPRAPSPQGLQLLPPSPSFADRTFNKLSPVQSPKSVKSPKLSRRLRQSRFRNTGRPKSEAELLEDLNEKEAVIWSELAEIERNRKGPSWEDVKQRCLVNVDRDWMNAYQDNARQVSIAIASSKVTSSSMVPATQACSGSRRAPQKTKCDRSKGGSVSGGAAARSRHAICRQCRGRVRGFGPRPLLLLLLEHGFHRPAETTLQDLHGYCSRQLRLCRGSARHLALSALR